MSDFESKTPGVRVIEETAAWTKSPFVRGLIAGTKGLLLGAPAGALVQAMRGKNAIVGAAVGGVGAGLFAAAAKAMEQDLLNQEHEGVLRYHAERLKSREPLFFMPPPHQLGQYFAKYRDRRE